VVWAATGLAVLAAGRGPGGTLYLRLSAAFFALWALLATTTLVYVVARGGGSAIAALLAHPDLLFAPAAAPFWAAGALGAGLVLTIGFILNQLVGRAILRTLAPRPLVWPRRLPRPATPTRLERFASERPEAFSFTLLVRPRGPAGPIRRQEVILVSDALLGLLTTEEREAVIAHELGHLHALDSRYLTFLRTCARLLRWDPVVALIARSVTRHEELRADRVAVELTGRPRALVSALQKVAGCAPALPGPTALGFLGASRWRRPAHTEDRIRRLLERSGDPAPERP